MAALAHQAAEAAAAKQAAEATIAELRAEAASLRAEAAASAEARREAEAARQALVAAESKAQALEVQLSPLGSAFGAASGSPTVAPRDSPRVAARDSPAAARGDDGHLSSPRSDRSGSFRSAANMSSPSTPTALGRRSSMGTPHRVCRRDCPQLPELLAAPFFA
jgi:hypothetical protein